MGPHFKYSRNIWGFIANRARDLQDAGQGLRSAIRCRGGGWGVVSADPAGFPRELPGLRGGEA